MQYQLLIAVLFYLCEQLQGVPLDNLLDFGDNLDESFPKEDGFLSDVRIIEVEGNEFPYFCETYRFINVSLCL